MVASAKISLSLKFFWQIFFHLIIANYGKFLFLVKNYPLKKIYEQITFNTNYYRNIFAFYGKDMVKIDKQVGLSRAPLQFPFMFSHDLSNMKNRILFHPSWKIEFFVILPHFLYFIYLCFKSISKSAKTLLQYEIHFDSLLLNCIID